jgi:hypothetical protein
MPREQPIRNCTFEVELGAAISEGCVARVEEGRMTATAYEWAGRVCVSLNGVGYRGLSRVLGRNGICTVFM